MTEGAEEWRAESTTCVEAQARPQGGGEAQGEAWKGGKACCPGFKIKKAINKQDLDKNLKYTY